MAATPKGSSKEKKVGAANKAKVEFQEYKKRIQHDSFFILISLSLLEYLHQLN